MSTTRSWMKMGVLAFAGFAGMELAASLCLLPQPATLTEAAGTCPTNVLVFYVKDPGVGSEGYRISISGSSVRVTSGDASGEFYANQTLAQLRAGRATYPCVEIEDAPAYRWRVEIHRKRLVKMGVNCQPLE